MLFNSLTFFAFLAVLVVSYRLVPQWTSRKILLLIGSYVFYSAWNPPFVVLLWLSTSISWFAADRMSKSPDASARRWLLALNVSVNLAILGYFKYGTFLLTNAIALMAHFGVVYAPPTTNIVLPVGISFYTFQSLSYVFDVYKKGVQPCRSRLDYALYVSFFPQLVAGPIVRATEFLPQCLTARPASGPEAAWGMVLFVCGLFNKVVVADTFMAPYVDTVFDRTITPSFVEAWAGTIAFSIQIFCDFSGYSMCAIGVALMFGFSLPDNFRWPYSAIGFSDFWRRWHISLSTWLRDYLYIPFGGNRMGTSRTVTNLMITMVLGGLWHGASWLFVLWGGVHGLYLVIEHGLRRLPMARHPIWKQPAARMLLALTTYLLTCIAWVFFRAHDLKSAMIVLSAMFGGGNQMILGLTTLTPSSLGVIALTATAMLTIQWAWRHRTFDEVVARIPNGLRVCLLVGLIFCVLTAMTGEERGFIYFQF